MLFQTDYVSSQQDSLYLQGWIELSYSQGWKKENGNIIPQQPKLVIIYINY